MKYNLKNFRIFDDAGEAYKWKEGFEAELRALKSDLETYPNDIILTAQASMIKEILGE